jgi:phosphopantetheine adenylyltransferase
MYENVLLTDEDYQKLQNEFPHDYSDRIERLSEYIASTGKKYKSHLATIRSWARKDTAQKPKSAKSSNPFLDMLEEGDYE